MLAMRYLNKPMWIGVGYQYRLSSKRKKYRPGIVNKTGGQKKPHIKWGKHTR